MEYLKNLNVLYKIILWLALVAILNPALFWGLAEMSYRTRSWGNFSLISYWILVLVILTIEPVGVWQVSQTDIGIRIIFSLLTLIAGAFTFAVVVYIVNIGGWRGIPLS